MKKISKYGKPPHYLVRRRNDDERLKYYSYFDGRHGIPSSLKKNAPRFDIDMAAKICVQLEKLDNRDWEIVRDGPLPRAKKKKRRKEKRIEARL